MGTQMIFTCFVILFLGLGFMGTKLVTARDLVTGRFSFADIQVYYQMVDVDPGKTGKVFLGAPTCPCTITHVRPVLADPPVILFLHGQKYSSENWINLGTLKLMSSLGYRTAAIDLPGYGKTRSLPYIDNNMRAEFLLAAFDFIGKGSNLTAAGAVLVSPSMSG